KNIFTLRKETKHGDPELQAVLQRHSQVFSEEVSAIEDFRATIRMQPGAQPVFCKARPVPYSLKEAVEKELDRMDTHRHTHTHTHTHLLRHRSDPLQHRSNI